MNKPVFTLDYTEEFFNKNKQLIGIKCKVCNRFWKDGPEHHEKDCLYNSKTEAEWEAEENRRLNILANMLLQEVELKGKVERLTNKELINQFIETDTYGQLKFGTVDYALVDEILERLEKNK